MRRILMRGKGGQRGGKERGAQVSELYVPNDVKYLFALKYDCVFRTEEKGKRRQASLTRTLRDLSFFPRNLIKITKPA